MRRASMQASENIRDRQRRLAETTTKRVAGLAIRLHRDERGAAIFWFLFLFSFLMVMFSLVVDFGFAFGDRRADQKSADAMALAGVLELPDSAARASQYASDWGTRNQVQPSSVANLVVDNSCWSGDPRDDPSIMDAITVDLSHPVRRFALGELGIGGFNVGAHAKACVGSLISARHLRPWAISTQNSSCFQGGVPLFGSECILRSTDFNASQNPNVEAGVINLGSTTCSASTSSNSVYRDNILQGSGGVCRIGDWAAQDTGNRANTTQDAIAQLLATEGACDAKFGPALGTRNGIDALAEVFDADPPGAPPGPNVTFTPKNCGPAGGVDNDPATPDSPRFVTIVLTSAFTNSGCPYGGWCAPVTGFAGFFIDHCRGFKNDSDWQDKPKCDLDPQYQARWETHGYFIQYSIFGGDAGPVDRYGTRVWVLKE